MLYTIPNLQAQGKPCASAKHDPQNFQTLVRLKVHYNEDSMCAPKHLISQKSNLHNACFTV